MNGPLSRVQSAAEQNPLHAGAQYSNFPTTAAWNRPTSFNDCSDRP